MLPRRSGYAMVLIAVSVLGLRSLESQVVRGSLRDSVTKTAVVGATITLVDSTGATVDETRSADDGTFMLQAKRTPKLRFSVRKVGVEPSLSGAFDIASDVDSLSVELLTPVTGVMLSTVKVTALRPRANFNTAQLAEARRFGWRVIEPHIIAENRGKAFQFSDLVRRNPLAGIRMPKHDLDCFTNSRTGICLNIIMDGRVLIPTEHVNISAQDVYFIAYLTAPQSQMAYGGRAPNGAIFIATRRHGDDERKPVTPPRF